MTAHDDSPMTFMASTGEAIAALEEAARRSGMQHLSGDAATGVLVFTAGRMVLASGEKVTAHVRQVAPGVVQVTLSSKLQFGLPNWGRKGAGRQLMAEALVRLLPPTGPTGPSFGA